MEDVARRRLAGGLAVALAGLIFALSSRRLDGLPGGLPQVDKLAHFAVYGVLGALVAIALAVGWRPGWRGLVVVALAMAYGASDEWHQSFVPGRQPSLADLVADTAGAAAGMLAVARRRARRLE